jgi:hypothetical protein
MAELEPVYAVEKYRWLKQQRQLELLDLETEVMRMPVLLQECGELTAIAIEIRESAKDEVEKVKAKVGADLRDGNRSETAIDKMIPLDPRYTEAQAVLSETRLDASLWQSLMESLRTKSSGMRVAADLIGVGFITQASIMQKRRREIREQPS